MSAKGSEKETEKGAEMETKMELNLSLGALGVDFCDFGRVWGSTFSDNFENAQKKVQQNDALRFEVPEGPPMQRVVAESVAWAGAPSKT